MKITPYIKIAVPLNIKIGKTVALLEGVHLRCIKYLPTCSHRMALGLECINKD